MKTLYLELNMGASGDMLASALYDLLDDADDVIEKINSLGIPGADVMAEKAVRQGIAGTHITVRIGGKEEGQQYADSAHPCDASADHHDHDHRDLADVLALIDSFDLSEKVRSDAAAVYSVIAEAEGRVHGRPAGEVHFHELGSLDAVIDVVLVSLLMERIGADRVAASAVNTGSGMVKCAHGILPVPAPATALILEGIPSYSAHASSELCTPTGAALIKHFAGSFGDRPVMKLSRVGYGFGSKEFEQLNCVRAFLGEAEDLMQRITKLECTLDDMTGEDVGFVTEELFAGGARDVYTQPIYMKKNRPGIILSCICLPKDADRMAEIIMKHTTTLGIRRLDMDRYALKRSVSTLKTGLGEVRVKTASGMGIKKAKAEYEDLAGIAREKGLSLQEVKDILDLDRYYRE